MKREFGRELTFAHGEGHRDHSVDTRYSIEDTDKVGQVVEDGQIVLDDDDVDLGVEEGADEPGGVETLLDIEVRRRLVEHVAGSGTE